MELKTRTKTEEIKVYITSDGREFDNEWEAENWEDYLKQEEIERRADILKVNLNEVDWPSMCNPYGPTHEYKWFRIDTEEDLRLFCESYAAWDRTLRDFEGTKLRFPYLPDLICLLDYPEGGEECDFFSFRQIYQNALLFLQQLPEDFAEKLFSQDSTDQSNEPT